MDKDICPQCGGPLPPVRWWYSDCQWRGAPVAIAARSAGEAKYLLHTMATRLLGEERVFHTDSIHVRETP